MIRSVVGPVVANLLLTGAGVAVLVMIGVVDLSVSGVLVGLGLGFMTGVAVVGLLLITAIVIGIPYGLATFGVTAVVVGAVGLGVAGMAGRLRDTSRPAARASIDAWRTHVGRWVPTALFVVFIAAYTVLGIRRSAVMPNSGFDSWADWSQKAILLTDFHRLPVWFFTGHAYYYEHQNYPLLLPLLESIWFRASGQINTETMHIEVWLLLIGFLWSAAFLLTREGVSLLFIGPPLILLALTNGVSDQVESGYADIPMALFVSLGVLSVGLWLDRRQKPHLVLGAILLAAAANIKSEGLVIALISLLVATLLTRSKRAGGARLGLLAAGGVVGATLPWVLWCTAHSVAANIDVTPLSHAVDPSWLSSRINRVWPAVHALAAQMSNEARWSYLFPIAAGVSIVCLVTRTARRVAVFYLITGLLVFASYIWVYWFSTDDLHIYVSQSDTRVVDAFEFIALAAILHVPWAAARQLEAARDEVEPVALPA